MLGKVKEFVNASFQNKNISHFERAVYWLEQLDPSADEPARIAAYAHDIERGLRKTAISEKFEDKALLKYHQEESGRIMYVYLKERGYPESKAKRVQHLIERHKVGGDKDQNAIMDADYSAGI